MMVTRTARTLLLCSALLSAPTLLSGQVGANIGIGGAGAIGTLDELADYGVTARGQIGLPVLSFLDVHTQFGWTWMESAVGSALNRFGVAELLGTDFESSFTFWHIGAGARASLGPLFIGANGLYFVGDTDEGLGFVPEAGIRLGRFELVADHRMDGELKWWAARLGFNF